MMKTRSGSRIPNEYDTRHIRRSLSTGSAMDSPADTSSRWSIFEAVIQDVDIDLSSRFLK